MDHETYGDNYRHISGMQELAWLSDNESGASYFYVSEPIGSIYAHPDSDGRIAFISIHNEVVAGEIGSGSSGIFMLALPDAYVGMIVDYSFQALGLVCGRQSIDDALGRLIVSTLFDGKPAYEFIAALNVSIHSSATKNSNDRDVLEIIITPGNAKRAGAEGISESPEKLVSELLEKYIEHEARMALRYGNAVMVMQMDNGEFERTEDGNSFTGQYENIKWILSYRLLYVTHKGFLNGTAVIVMQDIEMTDGVSEVIVIDNYEPIFTFDYTADRKFWGDDAGYVLNDTMLIIMTQLLSGSYVWMNEAGEVTDDYAEAVIAAGDIGSSSSWIITLNNTFKLSVALNTEFWLDYHFDENIVKCWVGETLFGEHEIYTLPEVDEELISSYLSVVSLSIGK